MSNAEILTLLRQIDEKVSALSLGGGGGGKKSGSGDSKTVRDFDTFCSSKVKPFTDAAKALGTFSAEIGEATELIFKEMRGFLVMADKCKKPSQADMMKTSPVTGMIAAKKKLEDVKMNRKNRNFVNHAKAACDGVGGAISWVMVPGPVDYLKNASLDAHQFWANKIKVQFKNSDDPQAKLHLAFLTTLRDMLQGLIDYVKESVEMGVIWNVKGGDALSFTPGAAPASSSKGKGKAPPPLSKKKKDPKPKKSGGGGGGMASVFAQLNQVKTEGGKTVPPGGALRKVTKDMKTKYRKDGTSVVSAAPKAPTSTKPKKTFVRKKNPLKEKKGNTWKIEDYDNETITLSADECDKKNTVYIYGCNNCTIIIEEKVNGITFDTCKKTQLKFKTVVGSAQIVNCQRVKVQVDEICPAFAVDKTDGIVLYLGEQSVYTTSISHSKSSEMNVSFPHPTDPDAGWIEKPIPEQFTCTISKDGKVESDVSELFS